LETLAHAILDGRLASGTAPASPLNIAATTLLLPTRRATRALQDAFLAASPTRAALLPRLKPIAEGDEDLSLLTSAADPGPVSADALEIPASVGALERQLALTSLVLRWSQTMREPSLSAGDGDATAPFAAAGAQTPAQAANLARELARLMDMVETENVALTGLADLVEQSEFSEHWQKTLTFLDIVTQWWPAHLEAIHAISPTDRRNRLILAEAARLTRTKPTAPMIVAGVTGSIPATVELMRAVASLPNGVIVLPGLDLDLDDAAWAAITDGSALEKRPHAEHPQFGLKTLLDRLGLTRADVMALERAAPSAARAARQKLVSEAMRPSSTTAAWHTFTAAADVETYREAIADVTLIEAPSAQDEAETVALILREAAETPGVTAALVSPDRLLARRVAVRLEAWGIRVDDSAGRPFGKTVPGTVLDLTIEALHQDFAPAPLMALLKHPLVRLGLDPFAIRRAARALELAAFRGPYLGRGLDGVKAALSKAEADCALDAEVKSQRRPKAVRRLFPEDWQGAHDLLARLGDAVAPLTALFASRKPMALAALAQAHAVVAQALCALPEPTPQSALWQGEAGRAAQTIFEGLTQTNLIAPEIKPTDYPDLYRSMIATENVRPHIPVHPRLSIWGPFEARLQQPDIVILGSLNDGTWPEAADPGPWLNRPMRAALGLPAPEEKIGYAAHDFTQLLSSPRVYLTRAQKVDGVPRVPSRWLMRLEAVLAGLGLKDTLRQEQGNSTYLAWARLRDAAAKRSPVGRPMPRPAVALRPRKLSVSAVETWIANPYAIYASRILGLEALPPLGSEPDAAIRGSIIHEALAGFVKEYPRQLPNDTEAALLRHAEGVLRAWTGHPRVAAFWLPRFERFARWFAETEPARRAGTATLALAEISGSMIVGPLDNPFTLTARADRLDIIGGAITITDYKTGTPPNKNKVRSQKAPQLPLEAAIALAGGFGTVQKMPVAALRYIRASGGEPAGEESIVASADSAELAAASLAGLEALVAKFDLEATPYAVTRRATFSYDYDEFAHLARVAEWSTAASDEEPS
jgi:ATP-dependent helicase/nuclease subunit B